MNHFWHLVGYEYKKLLCKKSVILAGVLAFAMSICVCFTMVIGSGNEQGNHYTENMSNYEAMLLDKSYEQALAGRILDTELILEASRAYQQVDINVPTYSKTESYQKYGRPYSSIYRLVDSAYASRGNAFNVQDFQNISEEEASNYYATREHQLRENLTNNPLYSAADVEQILAMDKEVQKPFVMAYTDGYQRFFALSITTMMAILFLISLIISPIFSGEYSQHTDSLILTSKNGKRSLIYAKLFTAFSISTGLTLIFLMSVYLTCMGIYGFDGTHAQIQILIPLITYDWTLLETTGLLIVTSLLGGVFHTTICMSVSAYAKKTTIPMAVSTILIMMGMFNGVQLEARYFLPLSMGSFYDTLSVPLLIHWFGIGIPVYQGICIGACMMSTLLIIVTIRGFRRHQVI